MRTVQYCSVVQYAKYSSPGVRRTEEDPSDIRHPPISFSFDILYEPYSYIIVVELRENSPQKYLGGLGGVSSYTSV